jgi:hypothetical protein
MLKYPAILATKAAIEELTSRLRDGEGDEA